MTRVEMYLGHSRRTDSSKRCRAILRYLKVRLGIQNKQIATLSGYTPSYLCHVSKGDCKASPQLVAVLEEVFVRVRAKVTVMAMCADTNVPMDKHIASRIQSQIVKALAKWPSKNRVKITLPKGVTGAVARVGKKHSDLFVVSLAPQAGEEELDILIHELREIKKQRKVTNTQVPKHKPAW